MHWDPALPSWNAAITHLAPDVSLCPLLEPWATLQSVVTRVLDATLLPVSLSFPVLCVLQIILG